MNEIRSIRRSAAEAVDSKSHLGVLFPGGSELHMPLSAWLDPDLMTVLLSVGSGRRVVIQDTHAWQRGILEMYAGAEPADAPRSGE